MVSKIRRYELTDEEWEHIKPYIPEEQEAGSRGRPSKTTQSFRPIRLMALIVSGSTSPTGMPISAFRLNQIPLILGSAITSSTRNGIW